MKPLSKKQYACTVNTATVIVVSAAILTDSYPEWRFALLGSAALASAACVYVYFRHRFDVLAGRAPDGELDKALEPTFPADAA